MVKSCCDSYHTQFSAFPDMLSYHEKIRTDSRWERTEVKNLEVAALDKASPLFNDTTSFDSSVSRDAIEDTAENLKLAIKVKDKFFPLRDTAYKSLLDRAKVGGSALPKLPREKLAELINSCLALHKDSALLLVRDEKVSAAHSGDTRDYSVLEIDQLLDGLQTVSYTHLDVYKRQALRLTLSPLNRRLYSCLTSLTKPLVAIMIPIHNPHF